MTYIGTNLSGALINQTWYKVLINGRSVAMVVAKNEQTQR